MAEQKSPPSEMIRVPVPLIGIVRQLSKLHRQGHTIALLQALEELVARFDSNIDIDLAGSKQVLQLQEKLEELESHLADRDKSVETKLEAMTKKLELIERAILSTRYNSQPKQRRQSYPYQQTQVELQPRTNESLAPRLGVTPQSLIAEREKLSTKEFLSYTRNRDPMSVGWEWNPSDGLYHPHK
ncbi:hypothetical protein Nos7524_0132 [Nostoc sp. PCC 7524]|uniref:hypothetical protein n=1 Tax=Nostoc sp. (strain ATCC 29411 / PCC 7524) TaxID=28072 RepID=UPI00029F05EF|nr:hypothetical protein [Nostoc sp. PCC 7524]AFY46056.1 hypothetical protein Nos7524_0132 [Nostoc sp. PCC 7524]